MGTSQGSRKRRSTTRGRMISSPKGLSSPKPAGLRFARDVQGLPITELELITVAVATLNFVIYILLWDKPLNVQRGVRVYKKRITEGPVDDGDVEATVGFWGAIRDAVSDLPDTIVRGPIIGAKQGSWLLRILFWSVERPFKILIGEDFGKDSGDLKRVNTFYPGEWVRSSFRGGLLVIAIASAFGGIHCIGWSFTFPLAQNEPSGVSLQSL